MARIGEFDFILMDRGLITAANRYETWIKQGHAGRGRHHGPRDALEQTPMTIAAASSAAEAQSIWEDYLLLQGETREVIDGLGVAHDDVGICQVLPALVRAGGLQPWSPCGGLITAQSATHVVMARWVLLLAEDITP